MKALIGARPIRIELDGGINPQNAGLVVAAGADTLVAGSAVFAGGSKNYAANITALRAAVAQGIAFEQATFVGTTGFAFATSENEADRLARTAPARGRGNR